MDKLWLGLDNENKHNCIFLWSDVCLLSAQNDKIFARGTTNW